MSYKNSDILGAILSDVVENGIEKHQLELFNNYINCTAKYKFLIE